MKTTKRLENAITKLYKAFHSGELTYGDCKRCAVGNICDNNSDWVNVVNCGNTLPYLKIKSFTTTNKTIIKSGYSPHEIAKIEAYFGHGTYSVPFDSNDFDNTAHKKDYFKGLEAVIKYLCELDNIDNVMDYTSLFEYDENNKAKQILTFK